MLYTFVYQLVFIPIKLFIHSFIHSFIILFRPRSFSTNTCLPMHYRATVLSTSVFKSFKRDVAKDICSYDDSIIPVSKWPLRRYSTCVGVLK